MLIVGDQDDVHDVTYIDHGLYVASHCSRAVGAHDAHRLDGDEPEVIGAVQHHNDLIEKHKVKSSEPYSITMI